MNRRQRRICKLVSMGLTNAQIAAELGCSVGAIKQVLRRVYREYGIRNRTQLTVQILGIKKTGAESLEKDSTPPPS